MRIAGLRKLMVLAGVIASSQVIACGVESVTLDKLRAESQHDILYIYGTMKHKCPEAAGIQLRITVFGKDGEIVDVVKPWPASVRNIPPNENYPFKILARTTSVKGTYNVEIESVKRWPTR